MRKSMKQALKETYQGLVNSNIPVSLTEKDLKKIGVILPALDISPYKIIKIRKKTLKSQVVFAKMLNVSASSVRKWESGERKPTGAAKILLEIIDKKPDILNYRIKKVKVKLKKLEK